MNNIFKESDGFNIKDLLKCALDHLRSAHLLFDRSPICFDSAGYLAHLGLELILKTILLNNTGEFMGIHDLKRLYKMALKSGAIELEKEELNILIKVNQFYNLRYVNPQKPVEIGDEDWKAIDGTAHSLLSNIPEDIVSTLYPGDTFEKGGRILMRKEKRT